MVEAKEFTLVGVGEILWDRFAGGIKRLGGAPANFAYHVHALGGNASVVSCVGDDAAGREIAEVLQSMGLADNYLNVDDRGRPTGEVTIELDGDGVPSYEIHKDVAWDYIPWTSSIENLAAQADAVCYGSLCQRSQTSRSTLHNFLHKISPQCLRVFDINIRLSYYSKSIIDETLSLSNVLKLNDEELPILADLLDMRGAELDILADLTKRYDLKLIVLTKGSGGSRLFMSDGYHDHPGIVPKEIVDTVGAGDAFTAAVTMGLLRGNGLADINEHANRIASFVCSQSGATPRLPSNLTAG